jgi:hypothetical protein
VAEPVRRKPRPAPVEQIPEREHVDRETAKRAVLADPQSRRSAALEDRDDLLERKLNAEYAPAWRPDQGDPERIIGTVIDLDELPHPQKDEDYAVVTLELKEGSYQPVVAVHCLQTVLASQMKRAKPKIGDRIAVERRGERPNRRPGGKPYRDYKVARDRKSDGADFWAEIQDRAEEEHPF